MKWFILLVALQIVAMVITLEFDCRREGQNCLNSGQCNEDGTCNCTAGYSNYFCDHDDNPGTNCSSECPIPGNCTLDGSLCRCPMNLYGPVCEYKRFQHFCGISGKIVINANVVGVADAIYVYNETSCPLDDTSSSEIPSGWEGPVRVINIPSDPDCGDVPVIDNEDGTSRYCVTARIRYRNDYWTDLDTIVTYCCSGTELSDINVASIDTQDNLPGTTLPPGTANSSDIDAKFYNASGSEITGAAIVGERINLRMRLTPDAVSVGLKPFECTLKGDPSLSDGVQLIIGGCPTDNLGASLTYNEPGSYDLDFDMVMFVGYNSVFVICDVRLCMDANNCNTDSDICEGRKKRGTSTTPDVQFVTEIEVVDPFIKSRDEAIKAVADRDSTIKLTAPVIVAIVLSILTVIGLVIFLYCMQKVAAPVIKA